METSVGETVNPKTSKKSTMSNDRIDELLTELQQEIEAAYEESSKSEEDDVPLNETSVVDSIPYDYKRDTGPDVPLVMARDGVKSSRDGQVLQIPTYSETHQMWLDGRDVIRYAFDLDASLTDINESIVLAGLLNLDDAYRIMESWGYGIDRSL